MLSFSEFTVAIKERIEKELGDQYKVGVIPLVKNNDVENVGIYAKKHNRYSTPIVHTFEYYILYTKGYSLERITDDVLDIIKDNDYDIINIDMLKDFNQMKKEIVYKLVNLERNEKLLKDIPYIEFHDLAITFCACLEIEDEEGVFTCLVTNQIMNEWKTNVLELYELAKVNTPQLFHVGFMSMVKVMKELAKVQLESDYDDERISKILNNDTISPLYILSNDRQLFGASVILYKGVLKEMSDMLKSDLLVLPSSINEVLVIPYDEDFNMDDIFNMIRIVNEKEVPESEFLSNSIYRYSRNEDRLFIEKKG